MFSHLGNVLSGFSLVSVNMKSRMAEATSPFTWIFLTWHCKNWHNDRKLFFPLHPHCSLYIYSASSYWKPAVCQILFWALRTSQTIFALLEFAFYHWKLTNNYVREAILGNDEENHMIILVEAKKKHLTEFNIHDKNWHQSGYRGHISQHNKGHLQPTHSQHYTQ